MLNVPVYGGDCVVSEDGSIRIIDFNDWPSLRHVVMRLRSI